MKRSQYIFKFVLIGITAVLLNSCAAPLVWPESPLYDFSDYENEKSPITDVDLVKQEIVGHYAHYDVVAYVDSTTKTPMLTFIMSYGFTDFYLDSLGNLIQSDRFVRATHKINQKNISSEFSDKAVQAIKPRNHKVEITNKYGKWNIYRAPTPSLLGINGDPSKPLPKDKNDPNITDPDGDGNPGVTVKINVGTIIKGEIYITRREIFTNYMTLNNDGTITGYVKDDSEQFVIGASHKMFNQPSNNFQHPAKGLNPIILVPIDDDIDTLEELWKIRDDIFPKEPDFIIH